MVIITPLFLGSSVTKLVRKFSWFSCKLNPKLVALSPLPSLVKEKETLLPGILGIMFRSSSSRSITRESLNPRFTDDGDNDGGGDGDKGAGGGGEGGRDCSSLTELITGL